jgi:hypothetical protein
VIRLRRALLAIPPTDRASLTHSEEILAEGVEPLAGMRRGLGATGRAYSLLDIRSLDNTEENGVVRQAAVPPITPTVSASSTSDSDLSMGRSCAPPPAASASARCISSAAAAGAVAAAHSPPGAAAIGVPLDGGIECEQESWWGGPMARRVLQVAEASRAMLCVDPSNGRVTNTWRFEQILALLPDEGDSKQQQQQQQQQQQHETRLSLSPTSSSSVEHPPQQPSGPHSAPVGGERGIRGGFTLLLEGQGFLACLGVGGCLVQRLRFTARLAERSLLLNRLRAAVQLHESPRTSGASGAAARAIPPPSLSSRFPLPASTAPPPTVHHAMGGIGMSTAGPSGGPPPTPASGGGLSLRRGGGMSSGQLVDFYDKHSFSSGALDTSAQEEQLRRMRDRFAAIRAANRCAPLMASTGASPSNSPANSPPHSFRTGRRSATGPASPRPSMHQASGPASPKLEPVADREEL